MAEDAVGNSGRWAVRRSRDGVATGVILTHTLPTPAEGCRQTNSANSNGFWDEWLH